MPSGIQVDIKVYHRLREAYQSKYTGSENRKADLLLSDIKQEYGEESVSNRTIQNFFNSETEPKVTVKTLDYLVGVLLGYSSYQECLASFSTQAINEAYWQFLKEKVQYVKVPNSSKPINLADKYIETELLEQLLSKRQKRNPSDILALINNNNPDPTDEQEKIKQEEIKRVSLKKIFSEQAKVQKLMVLGGPGSGKTTLLKYTALKIAEGKGKTELSDNLIFPIFVSLREFSRHVDHVRSKQNEIAVPRQVLLDYIESEIQDYLAPGQLQNSVLPSGNCLIMMDALDEVSPSNIIDVSDAIRGFVRRFYNCRFILTSRLGSSKYDFKELGFQEYEVASLSNQVKEFASIYFKQEPELLKGFISEYDKEGELPTYFLNGMSDTPLMLTMLFETFEGSGGKFPSNRYGLYNNYVETLLGRWDASRRIVRGGEEIISYERKRHLLGKIAFRGLRKREQITQWAEWELSAEIKDFLLGQESSDEDMEDRELESEEEQEFEEERYTQENIREIIRSLEEDDGILIRESQDIYQFRHINFQVFFAADHLRDFSWKESDVTNAKGSIGKVKSNLLQPNWGLLLIFLSGALRKGNTLLKLLFECTIEYSENNEKITGFLNWLEKVTKASGYDDSEVSWRAFYVHIDLHIDLYIDRNTPDLGESRELAFRIAKLLQAFNEFDRGKTTTRTEKSGIELRLAALHAFAIDHHIGEFVQVQVLHEEQIKTMRDVSKYLKDEVIPKISESPLSPENKTRLKEKLIELSERATPLKNSEKEKIKEWASELQAIMKDALNVGHNISFDKDDCECLRNYLQSVYILLNCLLSDLNTNRNLKTGILRSLFLPASHVRKYKADLLLQKSTNTKSSDTGS
jgi:energy-coupling factor transporter ATP-binding protein EcfA2